MYYTGGGAGGGTTQIALFLRRDKHTHTQSVPHKFSLSPFPCFSVPTITHTRCKPVETVTEVGDRVCFVVVRVTMETGCVTRETGCVTMETECVTRNMTTQSVTMDTLPSEIIERVLLYLSSRDLAALSLVSRAMRDATECETLWRELCYHDYGIRTRHCARELYQKYLTRFGYQKQFGSVNTGP